MASDQGHVAHQSRSGAVDNCGTFTPVGVVSVDRDEGQATLLMPRWPVLLLAGPRHSRCSRLDSRQLGTLEIIIKVKQSISKIVRIFAFGNTKLQLDDVLHSLRSEGIHDKIIYDKFYLSEGRLRRCNYHWFTH